jgi:outer membrane lipoprotein-sorting protein
MWEGQSDVSHALTGAMPDDPDASACVRHEWPIPKVEMHPMPVMRTRSPRMSSVPYYATLRRSTALLTLTLALAASWSGVSAADRVQPAAPDRFAELFARTASKRQSLSSIRARFTETTTSALLEKPLVAHGTVIGAPPARVVMTYTDPERKVVVLDGKTLTIAWPGRNERETVDISSTQKRIDQYFTNASVEQLRSLFDVTAAADGERPRLERVTMIPRRKQIKQGLVKLELWIDREALLLQQMEMTFASGDRKTIALDDVTPNVPVPNDTFQIRP